MKNNQIIDKPDVLEKNQFDDFWFLIFRSGHFHRAHAPNEHRPMGHGCPALAFGIGIALGILIGIALGIVIVCTGAVYSTTLY